MRPSFSILLILPILTSASAGTVPEKPDFNFHVQPILSDRCYLCHGTDPAKREAGLRLDQREAATAKGKHGAAIVPGDPANSLVFQRIFSSDPDDIMPPPKSHLELTANEKEILRRWIEQGAEYKRHWAFEPITAAPVPAGSHPVDFFIQNQLASAGLTLQNPAAKSQQLRRLSFDLTGLPPSLEEIDAFLQDNSPDAYEKQVTRLLASPAFGERMAQDWLDVARFADTFGYQSDVYSPVWPYRNFVIDSFNQNKPFHTFILEQLAGDLLPSPTREQIIATAFNRLHRQTNEGGSINEEYRVEYVADRVQTFGLAFLGLTLECAKCHDHKYDPVTQRDFYSLFSFFNNIDESGLYSHFTNAIPTPTLTLPDKNQEAAASATQQAVAAKEKELTALRTALEPEFKTWKASAPTKREHPGNLAYFPFEQITSGTFTNLANEKEPAAISEDVSLIPGRVGQAALLSGENNINMSVAGNFTRDDAFSFSLWIKTPDAKDRAVIFHRSKAWTDAASCGYELLIEDNKVSAALIHFWPGNAIRVTCRDALTAGAWTHVVWTYDGSSTAAGISLYLNGQPAATDTIRDCLTKDINRGGENRLAVGQRFRDRGFKDGGVDEFRIFSRELAPIEAADLFDADTKDPASPPPAAKDDALFVYFLTAHSPAWQKQLEELHQARISRSRSIDGIGEIMVMRELPQPKPAFILTRGQYDAPGEAVTADVPASIAPFPKDAPRNRLGLAKWLTDPSHPLCARVIVNRFWQSIFGRGLVTTPEDFGMQGTLPSHPELLNYLARQFIDSGWDTKALLKLIVTSAAYRQDSAATPAALQSDPENKLLSRGAQYRLSAEMIRDQALAASGQLDRAVGGPSVDPDKSSRRSLYTYWKRTMPDVRMEIFDMAKREVCIAHRQVTQTPLQALTLLNEPRFLQCARQLGEKALLAAPETDAQLVVLFRTLTSNAPDPRELTILRQAYSEQLAEFQNPATAAAYLKSAGGPSDPKFSAPQLAALASVAGLLFSFDAVVCRR